MNYSMCYMHLSIKLNDVVYQKFFILEFSLYFSVRKLHRFTFIKNDVQILLFTLPLTLRFMEEDKLMFCHSRMTVKKHAS